MSRAVSCLSLGCVLSLWLTFAAWVASGRDRFFPFPELVPLLVPGLALLLHQQVRRLPGPGAALSLSVVAAFLFVLVWPNFTRHGCQGQLTACKSNLKNIGTALEMYSTNYAGRYPRRASQLTPNYLKTIPTCPATGDVTYHIRTASEPDLYTVVCEGHHHLGQGIQAFNYPQYTSVTGLIERP